MNEKPNGWFEGRRCGPPHRNSEYGLRWIENRSKMRSIRRQCRAYITECIWIAFQASASADDVVRGANGVDGEGAEQGMGGSSWYRESGEEGV